MAENIQTMEELGAYFAAKAQEAYMRSADDTHWILWDQDNFCLYF